MEQNINLLISGKNNRLSLSEFLVAVGIKAQKKGGPLAFISALEILDKDDDGGLLLAASHHGQHLLLDDRSELLDGILEKGVLAFTRTQQTDILTVTLGDESGISWYNYYRDGKMQRSVTFEDTEPDEIGIPIPFEKNGVEPHSVLAAFCDSWKNLQKLEWEVYLRRNIEG